MVDLGTLESMEARAVRLLSAEVKNLTPAPDPQMGKARSTVDDLFGMFDGVKR